MKLNEWTDKYTLSLKKLTTKKEVYLAKFINHALQGGKFYWSIVVDHGNGEASTGRGSLEECLLKVSWPWTSGLKLTAKIHQIISSFLLYTKAKEQEQGSRFTTIGL